MHILAEPRRSKSELSHPFSQHVPDDRPFSIRKSSNTRIFPSVRFFPLFPEGSRKCTSGRNLSLRISFITPVFILLLSILLPPWLKCQGEQRDDPLCTVFGKKNKDA